MPTPPTSGASCHDIITRAMKFAGILAGGEQPAPEDEQDVWDVLNGMLDAWSMDRLYIPAQQFQVFALTANVQTVPIGLTAAAPFNVQCPNRIDRANIVITSESPNVRRPLYLMDDAEWMSISVRPLPTPTIPTALYFQRPTQATFPNGSLNFWPQPQSGLSVELDTWGVISQFLNLTDSFTFNPGYYEAIYQNLALRLCVPEWGIDTVPQSIQDMAQGSRMRIEALNMEPPPQLDTDAGMQGTRQKDARQGTQLFWAGNTAPQWNR